MNFKTDFINLDSLPICTVVYEIDNDGDFVFKGFNKKAEKIEKISRDDLIGQKVHEAFPGIKGMGLLDVFERVYATGEEETLEVGLYEDQNRYGWRRNIVSKLDDDLIIVLYEDLGVGNEFISDFEVVLSQKTKDIENQKQVFEELFEKSSDGILIIENGKFVQCNKKIVDMMGCDSKEQFLNTHPSEISPQNQPDGQNSFEKAEKIMALVAMEGSQNFEWLHTKTNGDSFYVDVTLTPISLIDKDVIHVIWRDISLQKEMEKQIDLYTHELEVKNKELEDIAKSLEKRIEEEIVKNEIQQKQLFAQSRLAQMGEMISMIAHQWRQPLGAISTTSANLKLKLELESFDLTKKEGVEEAQEYFLQKLGNIEIFVQSLTSTIDDFRNFYKPNKKLSNVQMDKLIDKAVNIVDSSLVSNNITLTRDCQSKELIALYENEIIQVLLNLFQNAKENFKDKNIKTPEILLSCRDTTTGVEIKACDNGGGIPIDILENIFDPYFSTKEAKNGTGLGLYMSKMIIEEHHKGSIEAFNKDNGVCFVINIKKENDNE